ncbi:BatA and WFA domain-containing protein, partial [bacterium]|nr:BatA and WFA domain-containing protein [bacterium]
MLPIIYHLIRKLRARKVRFSSLLFFKATPKELIRKRKLQDLILLIVRSAILGFLAFAFARPFIHEQNIPFVAEAQEKSTVVLIDGSYSMQYGSRFNTARTEALKRIRSAGPTDEISIVVFSDEASQLSELSQDIQLHANVVENGINVTNRGTDFYKPLKLAEDILKNAKNEVREILLFSDMQSNGWTRQFENWKIDPTIHFIPVKITEDHEINSYINAFDLKQKRRGETVIAQYGLQIITTGEDDLSTEVSLWVNNHQIETQHRDRKDFDQMVFQQQGLKEGIYQGYLALDKDDLFIDNFHYFSLTVESQPFILCIDPSYQSIKSNAFYLQNCFDLGDESLYRFQSA